MDLHQYENVPFIARKDHDIQKVGRVSKSNGNVVSLSMLYYLVFTSFFRIQERFPGICMNSSPRWKCSGKNSNSFRGITLFPFLPKRPKFSVPCICLDD